MHGGGGRISDVSLGRQPPGCCQGGQLRPSVSSSEEYSRSVAGGIICIFAPESLVLMCSCVPPSRLGCRPSRLWTSAWSCACGQRPWGEHSGRPTRLHTPCMLLPSPALWHVAQHPFLSCLQTVAPMQCMMHTVLSTPWSGFDFLGAAPAAHDNGYMMVVTRTQGHQTWRLGQV